MLYVSNRLKDWNSEKINLPSFSIHGMVNGRGDSKSRCNHEMLGAPDTPGARSPHLLSLGIIAIHVIEISSSKFRSCYLILKTTNF